MPVRRVVPTARCTSRSTPRTATLCRASTTPRSSSAPSRCTNPGCGPSTTPATTAPSSATRTATTSKRSSTAHRRVIPAPGSVGRMADTDVQAVRELLRDAFTRQIEHVDDLTDDLTDEVSFFRPTAAANSIAWLIWHSARQQDLQLCHLAGVDQVWTRDGWDDRFGLDLEGNDHGYGHSADDVGKVR